MKNNRLPISATAAVAFALAMGSRYVECDGLEERPRPQTSAKVEVLEPSEVDEKVKNVHDAVEEQVDEDQDSGELPEGSFTLADLQNAANFLKAHKQKEQLNKAWREQVAVPSIEFALEELGLEAESIRSFPVARAKFRDADGNLISMQFDCFKNNAPAMIEHGDNQVTPLIAVGQIQRQTPDGKWKTISLGTGFVPYNLLSEKIQEALDKS